MRLVPEADQDAAAEAADAGVAAELPAHPRLQARKIALKVGAPLVAGTPTSCSISTAVPAP